MSTQITCMLVVFSMSVIVWRHDRKGGWPAATLSGVAVLIAVAAMCLQMHDLNQIVKAGP